MDFSFWGAFGKSALVVGGGGVLFTATYAWAFSSFTRFHQWRYNRVTRIGEHVSSGRFTVGFFFQGTFGKSALFQGGLV